MPEVIFGHKAKQKSAAPKKMTPRAKAKAKHPNWGGRRPGSGRKPIGEEPLDAMIVVRMTDKQKAFYRLAGGSSWLRNLIEACMERREKNSGSLAELREDGAGVKDPLFGFEPEDFIPDAFPRIEGRL